MSFENTWALWLLVLLAPLVALFLLPLRKKRIVVASMILWEKVFEARNVKNVSRWVRVLATILLEGVILTAVVLAASRLYFSGSSSQYSRRVLVIDRSASMGAASGKGARFDQAKQILRGLVGSKGSSEQMMIVGSLNEPQVVCGWTSSALDLYKAIDKLTVTDAPGDLKKAIALAQSVCQAEASGAPAGVCVVSDSAEGLEQMTPKIKDIAFYPCGKGDKADNVGITAMDIRRTGAKGEFAVTLKLSGNLKQDASVGVEVLLDGKSLGKQDVSLAAGASAWATLNFASNNAGELEARLNYPDAMAADNRAYGRLAAPFLGKVYMKEDKNASPGEVLQALSLLAAMRSHLSEVELYKYAKATDLTGNGQSDDIFFFEGATPSAPPSVANLVIAAPQKTSSLLTVKGQVKVQGEPVARADHAILRGLDMRDLIVTDAAQIETPSWAEVLVESKDGLPLVLAGQQNGRKVCILTFSPVASGLADARSYPILINNLLEWMLPRPQDANLQCGTTVRLNPKEVKSVQGPSGVSSDAALYVDTAKAGFYTVHETTGDRQFGASTLSDQETSLSASQLPAWLKEASVASASGGGENLWYVLGALAAVLLMGEWFLYHYRYIE